MFLPQPPGFNWFSIFSKSLGAAKIIAKLLFDNLSNVVAAIQRNFLPKLKRVGDCRIFKTIPQKRAGTKKAGAFSRFDSRTWTSSIARHGFHYVQLWFFPVRIQTLYIYLRYIRYISAYHLIFMYSIYLQILHILCIYICSVYITRCIGTWNVHELLPWQAPAPALSVPPASRQPGRLGYPRVIGLKENWQESPTI